MAQEKIRVMFYNTENMFDTIKSHYTDDEDFTPGGDMKWNHHRYMAKLEDVADVVDSVGGGDIPALIGLCEVENASVIEDLLKQPEFGDARMGYIITNSLDPRGTNVALLYREDKVKVKYDTYYRPELSDEFTEKQTRDILYARIELIGSDELIDVFICHFPSRHEGAEVTEHYRVKCAGLLKNQVDSLFVEHGKANILIMGDFNDYPDNKSIYETLGAKGLSSSVADSKLYNLFYDKRNLLGTYKHRGEWGFLDQFIVSGELLGMGKKISILNNEGNAYSRDFMLQGDRRDHGRKPFRTYVGRKYIGGASDHLPIYLDLEIK